MKQVNETHGLTLTSRPTADESDELDHLLWEVLWKPLGLPRNFRDSVGLDGEEYEIAAREHGRVIGGLVAIRTSRSDVEIRHIAVRPDFQMRGVGTLLVASLVATVSGEGCTRVSAISRNTSAGFFEELGFRTIPDFLPEHPGFMRHGISFLLMEKTIG